jgi:phosphatidate phosphatase PAH1
LNSCQKISIFKKDNWKFSGDWKVLMLKSWDKKTENEQSIYANKKGDEIEFSFEGTGVSLMGNWVNDGGKADIYLDGKLHKHIDTYYDYSNQVHRNISIWHVFQLKPGKHVVKLVVTGDKNPAAAGTNVYLTEAIIYKTAPKKSDVYKFSFEH